MHRALLSIAVVIAGASASLAGPLPCATSCTILATSGGYLPPAQVVPSGATVTWTAVDAAHPTTDSLAANRCFVLPIGSGNSGSVRFRIVEGAVRATTSPGTPQAETATCASAIELPTGDRLLRFQCIIHPQMHGALLIQP